MIEVKEEYIKGMGFHGVANTTKAKWHVQLLGEAIKLGQSRGINDVRKETLEKFKNVITMVMPSMSEADTGAVLWSIRDPKIPEEMEGLPEELMPMEEILSRGSITGMIDNIKPLTNDQRQIIAELLDDLEVTHAHMAKSCSMLAALSRSLSSTQLMFILKSSVRPMVQINAMHSFLDKMVTSQSKPELPDDRNTRIKLTIIPDSKSQHITREKGKKFDMTVSRLQITAHHKGKGKKFDMAVSSNVCLLILRKFMDRAKQQELQEKYPSD